MPLDGASPARADILYLDNAETIDTGTGIDIRLLDNNNTGTNDITQDCDFTHANDNVERTFDPATVAVTTIANAGTTLQKKGWATRLTDVSPVDDTACNAMLRAGTLVVSIDVNWNQTGGTYATGTATPTWRASLWRYNPSTDAGVLIASGSVANLSWDYAATGDLGDFKTANITIVVAAGVEFSSGEVLLLQVGFNTGTVPNPTLGTANHTAILRINNATSRIDFAAAQGIRNSCVFTTNVVGEGLVPAAAMAFTLARTATGEGLVSSTKVVSASKTFNLIGEGLVSRKLALEEFFDLIGEGLSSMSRVVLASKAFTVLGEGVVPAPNLAITIAKTVLGEGLVSSTKAVVSSKTFTVLGEGLVSISKTVQASRIFDVLGEGAVSRTLAVVEDFDVIGEGLVSSTKIVSASKTFTIIGEGLVSRVLAIAEDFDVVGEGLVSLTTSVQAFRTFNLVGKGNIVITGSNTSTITIPIDEVPEVGGGGTTIIKKTYVFDD